MKILVNSDMKLKAKTRANYFRWVSLMTLPRSFFELLNHCFQDRRYTQYMPRHQPGIIIIGTFFATWFNVSAAKSAAGMGFNLAQ
jgi:hypothetical protein